MEAPRESALDFVSAVVNEHAVILDELDWEKIMKFFSYEHLPEPLQAISKQIAETAVFMADELPDNAEKTAGLRKLLEAKDCFVRANL